MHPSQNDIVLLILFTSLIFAVLAVFLVSLVNINARNQAKKQLELVKAIFETQEEERQRIARDLHDGLGSQFSAIKMHVGLLNEPEDNPDHISVSNTKAMIDNAVNDLRMITKNLLPSKIVDSGLVTQLQELKILLSKSDDLQINITATDEKMRFDSVFEINLYRILQEMINNTIKYAGARTIYIELENDADILKVRYRDDGTGFDPYSVKKGLGIRNIETRVKFYKGKMELQSARLGGTKYAINFDKNNLAL